MNITKKLIRELVNEATKTAIAVERVRMGADWIEIERHAYTPRYKALSQHLEHAEVFPCFCCGNKVSFFDLEEFDFSTDEYLCTECYEAGPPED